MSDTSNLVSSVNRAITIVKLLADSETGMLGVTELAARVGVRKSSIHRLLQTLQLHDLVGQDLETRKYRLGWGLYHLAAKMPAGVDLVEACRHELDGLAADTRECANVGVLGNQSVVIVARSVPRQAVITNMDVGYQEPVHATALGKVLLSEQREAEVRRIVGQRQMQRFTERTITSPTDFVRECQDARRYGFALDDGEMNDDVRCIAAPIRNHEGRVVAAISVSGPAHRMTRERIEVLRGPVLEVARRISQKMGFAAAG